MEPSPSSSISLSDRIHGGLWGVLVGDALGVPVEFCTRGAREVDPVAEMRGYGTHHQPPGTWSDDGALTLCNVEALIDGFSTRRMADLFLRWYRDAHWSARGSVFDIGIATRQALERVANGTCPEKAGGSDVRDNGNGAIMRILPIALRFADESPEQLLKVCSRAACITHGHMRSAIACTLYCRFAAELLHGSTPVAAYASTCRVGASLLTEAPKVEQEVFARFTNGDLVNLDSAKIGSSGYVVDTLEAAVWSVLIGGTFAEMTLRAVNLGEDTDTTAAATGGLAGVFHGLQGIPPDWRAALPRQGEIEPLFNRFVQICKDSEVAPVPYAP